MMLVAVNILTVMKNHFKKMKRLYVTILFLVINFILLIIVTVVARGQTLELEAVLWGSLHSRHDNQCQPDCAEEDNGGQGFFLSLKGHNKFYNVGIGRIYGCNSFGDPLLVDILQLMKVEFELGPIRGGASAWKMWIYGYYDKEKPIVHNIDPWPVFHFGLNPLYYWTDNFWITGRYIQFIGVSITFFTASYRVRF
jgi:hypothetical protein